MGDGDAKISNMSTIHKHTCDHTVCTMTTSPLLKLKNIFQIKKKTTKTTFMVLIIVSAKGRLVDV